MPDYDLIRSPKRKTIAIEVHRDQRVVVRVPRHLSQWEIHDFLAAKASWINQQKKRQAALPQKPLLDDYSDRSSHFLYGKPVQINYSDVEKINHLDNLLFVPNSFLQNDNKGRINFSKATKALKEWYRQQAREYFDQRLLYWLQQISHWQVSTPQLRLRYMRRYWGSCSSKNQITLNVHLIKVPPALIDYVITHELSHLREMNHSSAFYHLQETLLPDWRQRQQILRTWELRVLP